MPFFWDAWDIMLHSFETQTPHLAVSHALTDRTPSRVRLTFTYKLAHSTITQVLCLHADTPRVDFVTDVDWHEEKKLLKAYFPVDVRTDYATFDIQNGTIRRPTHANTSWDAAKHEVFAHKFVDVSEPSFGVALLNDSKYGCSVRDGVIGLSLLKAPKFPDHEADMGEHHFVYSLLPHEQSLNPVFEEAHKLNTPLWMAVVEPRAEAVREEYPLACEMFNSS